MAYDQELANRVEAVLTETSPAAFVGKKMFGGVGYMVNGNMACGVIKDGLIVRLGKGAYSAALKEPGAAEFDMTGRPITGWVKVDASVLKDEEMMWYWVRKGLDFALDLPEK